MTTQQALEILTSLGYEPHIAARIWTLLAEPHLDHAKPPAGQDLCLSA